MIPRSLTSALLFTLFLPGFFTATWASDWIYFARQGDTLWDLCLQYTNKRGCWIELAKYNGVSNDRTIPVGNEIRIPAAWLVTPPVVGSVSAVSGEVSYFQTSSASAAPLRLGQQLHLGARLESGSGSARLRLGADNELLLRANSVLLLDTMSGPSTGRSSAELGLPQGSVEVKVKPDGKSRFQITTPAAIAAVRGTEYRVNSLDGIAKAMRSEVLAGSVEVAAGKNAAQIPAGFGVAASQGKPPGAPRKLLPAPEFAQDYGTLNLPASIAWQAHPAAASWSLDLLEPGPSGALLASFASDNPGYIFAGLEQGCYRLQVRALDKDGFNGLDASAPVCIVPRLAAAAGLSDIDQQSSGNMQLSWSAVAGAHQYRLELAADDNFSRILQTRLTSDTSIEFPYSAATPFSARVIAIDAAGNESLASTSRDYRPPRETHWELIVTSLIALAIIL